MKTVYFTDKFPSTSHPVYAETQNEYGHVDYWNTFHSETEMEEFIEKLFFNETVQFKRMRSKKA